MSDSIHTAGPAALSDRGPRRVVLAVRAGVLALCAVLALGEGQAAELRLQLGLLALLATIMSLPPHIPRLARWRPVAEGVGAAAIVASTAGSSSALLPYLVVGPAAAGVLSGFTTVFVTVAASSLTLVTLRPPLELSDRTELAQWIGLGLAVGLLGAWARSTANDAASRAGSYAAANRLLTELGEVARTLPTGLDEVSLARSLLDDLSAQVDLERAALYARTESGYVVPLAFAGADRLDWDPDQGDLWTRAWRSGRAEQAVGMFSDPDQGHRAVVPLRLGERVVGVVAFERAGPGWSRHDLGVARTLADEAALRLDTGRLFSELRAMATVEERRRVAREIHDGVAQEVAALGFIVDDLASGTSDLAMRQELRGLRAELTRIVSELRLSIFDLRSEVEPASGLGAALGSYVRQVGTGSGMTVHLVLDESAHRLPVDVETELLRVAQEAVTNARKHSRARNLWVTCRVDPPRAFLRVADDGTGMTVHLVLDESAHRLPVDVETELLRVAQEAVTNARKHSRARNLWVTCRVDPPRAFLRVADDGTGMGAPRSDSYGLDIMRERTERLGASLSVRGRVGGGTVVEVTLDGAAVRPSDRGRHAATGRRAR